MAQFSRLTLIMNDLEKLLKQYGKRWGSRWWIGERPVGRENQIARIIAKRVGYPSTSIPNPFDKGGLVPLDAKQAGYALALAGTCRLADQFHTPSSVRVEEAQGVLQNLEASATFLSNQNWGLKISGRKTFLTNASFECGVIGFDSKSAFIFWVEEEG